MQNIFAGQVLVSISTSYGGDTDNINTGCIEKLSRPNLLALFNIKVIPVFFIFCPLMNIFCTTCILNFYPQARPCQGYLSYAFTQEIDFHFVQCQISCCCYVDVSYPCRLNQAQPNNLNLRGTLWGHPVQFCAVMSRIKALILTV